MKTWPLAWMKAIGCTFLFCAVAWFLLAPVFIFRGRSSGPSCVSNLKQLELSFLMYAADHNDALPPLAGWKQNTLPYVKNESIFLCPAEKELRYPSYGYNIKLGGQNRDRVKLPEETVLLFEAKPGPNQIGGQGLLPDPPRHLHRHTIGFLDGHVKAVAVEDISKCIWRPQITQPIITKTKRSKKA